MAKKKLTPSGFLVINVTIPTDPQILNPTALPMGDYSVISIAPGSNENLVYATSDK